MTDRKSTSTGQLAFRLRYLDRIPIEWHQELVEDIALPPFQSRGEYRTFLRRLRRQLGAGSHGEPSPTELAVTEIVRSGLRRCGPTDRQIELTAAELASAFVTNLPAPWTVHTLAPALVAAGMSMSKNTRGRWSVDGTSRISAYSAAEDCWHITVFEGGARRRGILDQQDFIVLLMQQFLSKNQGVSTCPLGWAFRPKELRALIPGAVAVGLSYANDILSPAQVAWMRDHTLAYAQDRGSIAHDKAELLRLRSLASARARDALDSNTFEQRIPATS
ncbi:hypothetical protein [Gordonia sp. CPCC 205333]|uniref:hypothetical protein n=1 Tax=Gordonia sp. CPCC 205333 TaxID=3140790 RepID=UPI003AF3DA88